MSFQIMNASSNAATNAPSTGAADKYNYKKKQQQVMVPKMHYQLIDVPNYYYIYDHLNKLFENVTSRPSFDAMCAFKQVLYQRNNRSPTVFSNIRGPANTDIMRQVIGKDGYFFKMTTTLCGVDFLWYDKNSNNILCWGPSNFKVVKALNSIRWRIFKNEEQAEQQQAEQQQAEQQQAEQQKQQAEEERRAAAAALAEQQEDDCDYSDMPPLIDVNGDRHYSFEFPISDLFPEQISSGRTPDHESGSLE